MALPACQRSGVEPPSSFRCELHLAATAMLAGHGPVSTLWLLLSLRMALGSDAEGRTLL